MISRDVPLEYVRKGSLVRTAQRSCVLECPGSMYMLLFAIMVIIVRRCTLLHLAAQEMDRQILRNPFLRAQEQLAKARETFVMRFILTMKTKNHNPCAGSLTQSLLSAQRLRSW